MSLYVGASVVQATNIIPDGDMEQSSWSGGNYDTNTKLFGSRSQYFTSGNTIVQTISTSTIPIVGHKYYGRHYLKTNGDVNALDCRFEWFAGDGPGLNFVFGWNRGNYSEWTMESSIIDVTELNATSGFVIRSFMVNSTGNLWADGLMIVDLTSTYGVGNEPSKVWCDENIPFFVGTTNITAPPSSGFARKIKRFFVGVNSEVPVYGPTTVNITGDNIADYFGIKHVWNGGFIWDSQGKYFTASGTTQGVRQTDYTALQDMQQVTFTAATYYNYNSDYKFTVKKNGETIFSSSSFSAYSETITTSLLEGDVLSFAWSRYYSGSYGRFYDFSIYTVAQTGTTWKNVARAIKKLYVGVNGIARKVFGSGKLVYSGKAISLQSGKYEMGVASIPGFCIYAKGGTAASPGYTADAYNPSLTHSTFNAGTSSAWNPAGVNHNGIAKFAGGRGSDSYISSVVSVNSSLTVSSNTNLTNGRRYIGAACIGNYSIFLGGYNGTTGSAATKSVDFYDSSNTHTTATLSVRKQDSYGASLQSYAVFSGGEVSGTSYYDYAYNASKTLTSISNSGNRSTMERGGAVATVGGYGLFVGSGSYSDVYSVWAYDNSLTKVFPTNLSENKYCVGATSIGEYAMFVGGYTYYSGPNNNTASAIANAYDESLTMTIVDSIADVRADLTGGTVGNYALFAGGFPQSTNVTKSDVYKYTYDENS